MAIINPVMFGGAQEPPTIEVSASGLITAKSGDLVTTKQLATQAGTTITPGTAQKTAVSSGRYTTGNVYVAGDADLVPGNIRSGANIFGVAGNLQSFENPRYPLCKPNDYDHYESGVLPTRSGTRAIFKLSKTFSYSNLAFLYLMSNTQVNDKTKGYILSPVYPGGNVSTGMMGVLIRNSYGSELDIIGYRGEFFLDERGLVCDDYSGDLDYDSLYTITLYINQTDRTS